MFKVGDKIIYINDEKVRLLKLYQIYTISSIGCYSDGVNYFTLKEIDNIEKFIGYPSILFECLKKYRKLKIEKLNEK